jgi:hypothetical protein
MRHANVKDETSKRRLAARSVQRTRCDVGQATGSAPHAIWDRGTGKRRTCDMRWSMQRRHARGSVQETSATANRRHATYGEDATDATQRATHNVQTTCAMQRALCSKRHATRTGQRATCARFMQQVRCAARGEWIKRRQCALHTESARVSSRVRLVLRVLPAARSDVAAHVRPARGRASVLAAGGRQRRWPENAGSLAAMAVRQACFKHAARAVRWRSRGVG